MGHSKRRYQVQGHGQQVSTTRGYEPVAAILGGIEEFEEPVVPTREYWVDPGRTIKTYDRTAPGTRSMVVDNPPVLEDWEQSLKVEEYKAERKVYTEQVLAWKENKAKCYYLVLLHCSRALEHQLKNSPKWDETESNQDVVALLQMIRDITHNNKERKESIMAIVESDFELYTIARTQGSHWTSTTRYF